MNRMGVANKKKKFLYPSCYLYEKDNEMYLIHFKELFLIRGSGYNDIFESDIIRRNAIAFCLKNWGLIDINDKFIQPHNMFIFVLPHKLKNEWKICHKINLSILNDINNGDYDD